MKTTIRTSFGTLFPLLAFPVASAFAGVGESAVITLVFPHNARSSAIGELGVALADGDDAMYWNPAGLGQPNSDWRGGTAGQFYEQLLPAFNIDELWHAWYGAVYRPPWRTEDWGAFSVDLNLINMGHNAFYDEIGGYLGTAHSREWVASLGWGLPVGSSGRHFVGATAKLLNSALAPEVDGDNEGVGRGIAFDIGYLWTSRSKVRAGATFSNMGPSVFYTDESNSDPLPFTVRLAVGYKDTVSRGTLPIAGFRCETLISREFVASDENGEPYPFYQAIVKDIVDDGQSAKQDFGECQMSWGGEVTLFETVSGRLGVLFDWSGERYEVHWGMGWRIFNHLDVSLSAIHSPEGMWKESLQNIKPTKQGSSGARQGQWGLTVTMNSLARWSRDDFIPLNLEKLPGGWPGQRAR